MSMSQADCTKQELKRVRSIDIKRDKLLKELKSSEYKNEIQRYMQQTRLHNLAKPSFQAPKVAMIGLGPTGLVGVIDGFLRGYKTIDAVEPRDFTRTQVFRLEDKFIQDLITRLTGLKLSDLDSSHPLSQLIKLGVLAKNIEKESLDEKVFWTIQINDFQKLLLTLLEIAQDLDPAVIHLHQQHSFKALSEGGIILEQNKSGKTKTIDGLDLVLGADGAASTVAQIANIAMKPSSDSKPHMAINLLFCNGQDGLKTLSDTSKSMPSLSALEEMGWVEEQEPTKRVFFTGKGVYLGAELSDKEFEALEGLKSTVKQYEQKLRQAHNPITKFLYSVLLRLSTNLLGEEYEKIARVYLKGKATSEELSQLKYHSGIHFALQLQAATTKTQFDKNSQLPIVLVGDANATAHYQTGSGAVTGIKSILKLQELVVDSCKGDKNLDAKQLIRQDLTQYNVLLSKLANKLHNKVNQVEDVHCNLLTPKQVHKPAANDISLLPKKTLRSVLSYFNIQPDIPEPVEKSQLQAYLNQNKENSPNTLAMV